MLSISVFLCYWMKGRRQEMALAVGPVNRSLHYITLQYTALPYTTSYCMTWLTLHYLAIHYNTSHHNTSHHITSNRTTCALTFTCTCMCICIYISMTSNFNTPCWFRLIWTRLDWTRQGRLRCITSHCMRLQGLKSHVAKKELYSSP